MYRITFLSVATFAISLGISFGDNARVPSPDRGALAVRGKPAMNPPAFLQATYDNAWKRWGVKEKPVDYSRAFRERYGLHEATYENGDLPMGMHAATGIFGKGVGTDCLMCHAGRVAGQTIIGLANANMDVQGISEELVLGDNPGFTVNFKFASVRGTIDPVSPVAFIVGMRDHELNLQAPMQLDQFDNVCSDPPAWWQIKKKKTRDWTGAIDARSTRIDMANLFNPLNSAEYIKGHVPTFEDIHQFVSAVQPPKYPFAIDEAVAAKGRVVFEQTCARCHGTYGSEWTYPNKIVPFDKIGTDPLLGRSLSDRNLDYLNRNWLTRELGPDGKAYKVSDTGGYQAPPLDGIWATAPYLHNSSVPTLYHMLKSSSRPKFYTRSYRSEKEDYDPINVGLKITILDKPTDASLSPYERRKIYDTTLPGRSNAGHTYGDELSEEERLAVMEYLKTL